MTDGPSMSDLLRAAAGKRVERPPESDHTTITGSANQGRVVWMATPVAITSYTMRQGFSLEDGQYGITALVRAGWILEVSDESITLAPEDVTSWAQVHDAEASASVQDSTHTVSGAGAHLWWRWRSTVQDPLGEGALQIDWLMRESEYTAVLG